MLGTASVPDQTAKPLENGKGFSFVAKGLRVDETSDAQPSAGQGAEADPVPGQASPQPDEPQAATTESADEALRGAMVALKANMDNPAFNLQGAQRQDVQQPLQQALGLEDKRANAASMGRTDALSRMTLGQTATQGIAYQPQRAHPAFGAAMPLQDSHNPAMTQVSHNPAMTADVAFASVPEPVPVARHGLRHSATGPKPGAPANSNGHHSPSRTASASHNELAMMPAPAPMPRSKRSLSLAHTSGLPALAPSQGRWLAMAPMPDAKRRTLAFPPSQLPKAHSGSRSRAPMNYNMQHGVRPRVDQTAAAEQVWLTLTPTQQAILVPDAKKRALIQNKFAAKATSTPVPSARAKGPSVHPSRNWRRLSVAPVEALVVVRGPDAMRKSIDATKANEQPLTEEDATTRVPDAQATQEAAKHGGKNAVTRYGRNLNVSAPAPH